MIYIINENEVINEGFLANLKEKRAAKKAAKEEKRIQKMIDNGNILVNGKKIKNSYKICINDVISIIPYEEKMLPHRILLP